MYGALLAGRAYCMHNIESGSKIYAIQGIMMQLVPGSSLYLFPAQG